MKFFTSKKTVQKIVIMLVLVISCNFIMPIHKVRAVDVGEIMSEVGGFAVDIFVGIGVTLIDAAFNGIQNFMIGGDYYYTFMYDRDDTNKYYRFPR